MTDSFTEAIKTEQKRILRLIELSPPSELQGRGHLHLQRRGSRTYAYERWQQKGKRERNVYLGLPDSAPVQALFGARFRAQRLERLRHDQKLLARLQDQYLPYDFDSVEDGCVTVRDRDTMDQVRLPIAELESFLAEKIDF